MSRSCLKSEKKKNEMDWKGEGNKNKNEITVNEYKKTGSEWAEKKMKWKCGSDKKIGVASFHSKIWCKKSQPSTPCIKIISAFPDNVSICSFAHNLVDTLWYLHNLWWKILAMRYKVFRVFALAWVEFKKKLVQVRRNFAILHYSNVKQLRTVIKCGTCVWLI